MTRPKENPKFKSRGGGGRGRNREPKVGLIFDVGFGRGGDIVQVRDELREEVGTAAVNSGSGRGRRNRSPTLSYETQILDFDDNGFGMFAWHWPSGFGPELDVD